MAKYKRAEEADEDLSYAEEMQQQQQVAEEGPPPADAEEASFKKRYGDLRRHSQQLMQQKDQELAEVKRQLDAAAKGQIKSLNQMRKWMIGLKSIPRLLKSLIRLLVRELTKLLKRVRKGWKV